MSKRVPGLTVQEAGVAARKVDGGPMIECQHCSERWAEGRYDRLANGERVKTCPRCLYTGRFNQENRRAAMAGDPLPVWGLWQPVNGFQKYNPWTAMAEAPMAYPDGMVATDLIRPPRGFVLDESGLRAERSNGGFNQSSWVEGDRLVDVTFIKSKYPFKCVICGHRGKRGEEIAYRQGKDDEDGCYIAHRECHERSTPTRVEASVIVIDAAQLFQKGYREDDFLALSEAGMAMITVLGRGA